MLNDPLERLLLQLLSNRRTCIVFWLIIREYAKPHRSVARDLAAVHELFEACLSLLLSGNCTVNNTHMIAMLTTLRKHM